MSELLLDGETYDYLWLTDHSHPKAQQILRQYHGCTERPCCQCLDRYSESATCHQSPRPALLPGPQSQHQPPPCRMQLMSPPALPWRKNLARFVLACFRVSACLFPNRVPADRIRQLVTYLPLVSVVVVVVDS
ncbi:hypothetical protein MKLM6_1871 [Methylomonas koyamae]|nr:hypothetical protein MKLM6_1871 [Methylomonas koyamae]